MTLFGWAFKFGAFMLTALLLIGRTTEFDAIMRPLTIYVKIAKLIYLKIKR